MAVAIEIAHMHRHSSTIHNAMFSLPSRDSVALRFTHVYQVPL